MNSQPPLFITTRFNDRAFQFSNYITKEQAEQYFISNLFMPMPGIAQASKLLLLNAASSISGINSFGVTSITLNGGLITASADEINYNDITTIGIAQASKALILDADSKISGIHTITATNLTATNLTGTLVTAAQTNITSIGTQLDLRVNGFIQQSSNITSDSFRSIRSASTFKMIHNLNSEMQLGMTTDNAMSFITNNVNRMTIAANGRVSVVNNSAAVSSSDASVTLSGGLGVASNIIAGAAILAPTISATTSMTAPQYIGRFRCNQNSDAASTFEGATNAFQISSDPTGALSSMNVYMGCSSGNQNAFIQCSMNVSPFFGRLLLNPRGGGCLIGATSTTETQTLVVEGTARVSGVLTANGIVSSVDVPLQSVRGTSTLRFFHLANSDGYVGMSSNNTLHLVTNNANRVTISASGDVNVLNGSMSVFSNATVGGTTTSSKLVVTSDLASNGPILGGLWEGSGSFAGGVTIAKNLWIGTTLNVGDSITTTNDISSRRLILNAENNNIRINKPSDVNSYTQLSFNGGLSDNQFSIFSQKSATNWSGVFTLGLRGTSQNEGGRMTLLSSLRGTSTMDLGAALRDNILIVRQGGGLSANMIGCNANTFTMTSAQPSGFSWHCNTSALAADWEALGAECANLNTIGEFRSTSNMFTSRGVHAHGFEITNQMRASGGGVHLQYTSSIGYLFAYNYATLAVQPWHDLQIGNNALYVRDSVNSHVGIGTITPAYPLDVQRTVTASLSGGYGYLAPSGTGTGGGTGNVSMSIRAAGRIVCPEFNAHSDRRIKANIVDIKLETALKFVKDVRPRQYNLIGSSDVDFGFIAQEILKTDDPLINDIVSWHPDETMVADDESPAGYKASVSYNEIIPLLHRALADALERIESVEAQLLRSEEAFRKSLISIEQLEARLQARGANGRFTKRS